MNKNINKNTQAGFTLIELIVVIVILGILAATALPKFANLSGDARAGALKGALGSVNSVVAMTHGQALANSSSIKSDGKGGWTVALENVALVFDKGTGFPKADTTLADAAGLSSSDFTPTVATGGATMTISPVGVADATKCAITYTAATGLSTITTADCN